MVCVACRFLSRYACKRFQQNHLFSYVGVLYLWDKSNGCMRACYLMLFMFPFFSIYFAFESKYPHTLTNVQLLAVRYTVNLNIVGARKSCVFNIHEKNWRKTALTNKYLTRWSQRRLLVGMRFSEWKFTWKWNRFLFSFYFVRSRCHWIKFQMKLFNSKKTHDASIGEFGRKILNRGMHTRFWNWYFLKWLLQFKVFLLLCTLHIYIQY